MTRREPGIEGHGGPIASHRIGSRGIAARGPVLLGVAALTRAYVEQDLAGLFQGEVRYARDAFEGLRLMDSAMAVKRGWIDEKAAVFETLTGIHRAGADLVITYWAPQMARWLSE